MNLDVLPTCTTAVAIVTRSAQVPTGYAAFSTLAPWTTVPPESSSEHPTLNLEYGPALHVSLSRDICLKTNSKPSPSPQYMLQKAFGLRLPKARGSERFHDGYGRAGKVLELTLWKKGGRERKGVECG
jgi:hypothetical protein